jgi:hypothetical protein
MKLEISYEINDDAYHSSDYLSVINNFK